MINTVQPDVIFAEAVGSCADIVSTVVKPLFVLSYTQPQPASFSVFADARLLHRRLRYQDLPFNDDVAYIFDKQIEEARLLVVNKVDLLTDQAIEDVRTLLEKRLPGKPYIMQSSLTMVGIQSWLDEIQSNELDLADNPLELDYTRYGSGEARLAWLDMQISLRFPNGQGRRLLIDALSQFIATLSSHQASIGHLKIIIFNQGLPKGGVKLSFPTLIESGWVDLLPDLPGDHADLLINARVEIEAPRLKDLLERSLADSDLEVTFSEAMAFHPPQPRPSHRL